MTNTVFMQRMDINVIDTGHVYKLEDFEWHQRATGCFSFLVGPKQNLLSVARTALVEANMVDK